MKLLDFKSIFVALLTCISFYAINPAEAGPGKFEVNIFYRANVEIKKNIQVFTFKGSLPPDYASYELWEEINRLDRKKPVLLVMDSTGGDEEIFFNVLSVFRGMDRQREIIAYVPNGAQCSSACITWFLGADYRLSSSGAKFGFHSGKRESGELVGEARTIEFLRRTGANQELIGELSKNQGLEADSATYLSAAQMRSLGSLDEIIETNHPSDIKFGYFRKTWTGCARLLRKIF